MTDRYVPNGTPLTAHEREILTILQEEAAEVIQAASKLLRFGKDNRPADGEPNTEVLSLEVGDLEEMIFRSEAIGLLDARAIARGRTRKAVRLRKYLQHPPGEVK